MMAGKILALLITAVIYFLSSDNGTEGLTPPLARLQCTEKETCRYVILSYSNNRRLCFYQDLNNRYNLKTVQLCVDNNEDRRDKEEEDNYLYPYYYSGISPKCPPLEEFSGGYWSCQDDIPSSEVTVYTSCEPICGHGQLEKDFYVRCNESRKWEYLQKPTCVKDSMPLEDFIAPVITLETSTPMEIKVSWLNWGDVKINKLVLYLKSTAMTVLRNVTVSADTTSYRFKNLTLNTTYVIQLKAVSDTGYEALSTSTNITTHSPEIFRARNVTWYSPSPSQININWSPAPDSMGVVTGFSIYSNSTQGLLYKCISLSPVDTSCELRNLTEGTKYMIIFKTQLKNGISLSSAIPVETEEFNPQKPVNVKVLAINTTAILVQFTLPDQRYFDIFVTSFSIDISGAGSDFEVQYSSLHSNVTHQYVVSSLKPDTVYSVQIAACTQKCKCEKSAAVSVRTLKAPVPQAGFNYTVLLPVGIAVIFLFLIVLIAVIISKKNQRTITERSVLPDKFMPGDTLKTSRTDFKSGTSSEFRGLLPTTRADETMSRSESSETGSGSTGSSETGSNETGTTNSVSTVSTVVELDNKSCLKDQSISLKNVPVTADETQSRAESSEAGNGSTGSSETGNGSTGSRETGSNEADTSKSVCTDSTMVELDNESRQQDQSICLTDVLILNPHSLSDDFKKSDDIMNELKLPDAPPLSFDREESSSIVCNGNGTIENSKNDKATQENMNMRSKQSDNYNLYLPDYGDKSPRTKYPFISKTTYIPDDNHNNELLHCDTKEEIPVICTNRGKRNIGYMAQLESDDGPPPIPTNFTITAKAASSISLSWSTVSQHAQTFTIDFKVINSAESSSSALPYETGKPGMKIVHEITDLKEDTEYEFRLYTSNTNGKSSYTGGLKARTLKIDCDVTMVKAFDSNSFHEFFISLGHKIDPDIHGDQMNWKGLFKSVLEYNKDHIEAIGHHTRGNPDNGHFMQNVEKFKYKNLCLGHILEYFTRKNSLRKDVIQLFSTYHRNCGFCDEIYKEYL